MLKLGREPAEPQVRPAVLLQGKNDMHALSEHRASINLHPTILAGCILQKQACRRVALLV